MARNSSRRTVVAQLLLGAALLGGSNLIWVAAARAAKKKGKGAAAPATPAEEGKNLKPGQFTDLAATPDTRTDKSMVVMDGPAK